ncbi:MAG: GNAT family N-acetyltransferase [Saprospiraceae bacterium]|nr:GNAT family N-acetyltransferase [Candidatus Brachybacter algidus]
MNNESIGSIRFDLEDNKAIISYLLDPAFHGRGLGQALQLIKGCKTFLS